MILITRSCHNWARWPWGPLTQARKAMLLESTQPYLFLKNHVCIGHYQLSPSTGLSQKHISKLWFLLPFPSFPQGRTSSSLVHQANIGFLSTVTNKIFKEKETPFIFIIHLESHLKYCERGSNSFWNQVLEGREKKEGHRIFMWGTKGKCLLFQHGALCYEEANTIGQCQTRCP